MKTPYLITDLGAGQSWMALTFCSYNIAEKHNFLHAKGTRLQISIHALIPTDANFMITLSRNP
jgi:hypothetical protein